MRPSIVVRTSLTPAFTADSWTKARAVLPATARASVVFPVPGGPQQQHRRQPVALDEGAQRSAGADEVFLPDDVVERARSQSGSEGRPLQTEFVGGGGEEVVAHQFPRTRR